MQFTKFIETIMTNLSDSASRFRRNLSVATGSFRLPQMIHGPYPALHLPLLLILGNHRPPQTRLLHRLIAHRQDIEQKLDIVNTRAQFGLHQAGVSRWG
jgi:hypothetical protein